jgi:hypothetical protein
VAVAEVEAAEEQVVVEDLEEEAQDSGVDAVEVVDGVEVKVHIIIQDGEAEVVTDGDGVIQVGLTTLYTLYKMWSLTQTMTGVGR